MIVLTAEQKDIIRTVTELYPDDSPTELWEKDELSNIKASIKTYYLGAQNHSCCYCKRNLFGEFRLVIDIEHILPKSKFKQYMFDPFNLSISCKRCNMQVKGEDISFLIDRTFIQSAVDQSESYKFVHPNFDTFEDHIFYLSVTNGNRKIITYIVKGNSPKGKFTYEYFELEKLEIQSINKAQGIKEPDSDKIDGISNALQVAIENFLSQL